ncbi:hypothetical protein ACKGJO_06510 [Gracilimonas sp. Q87]|uniref:hypothetical protein n=1 Tax=Gracilimonas sp. Q87 TaxID=3384766 RepID=UPI003984280E
MKFTLIYESSNGVSAENYDKDHNRFSDEPIESLEDAKRFCKDAIDYFNGSLRRGETEREYVDCIYGNHAKVINITDHRLEEFGPVSKEEAYQKLKS